jgi:hypothetical protein
MPVEDERRGLEEKFDPEVRFRTLRPGVAWLVSLLLFSLSAFHYYTAGFGLLREVTHRGVHMAFVLGLIFLVFAASSRNRDRTHDSTVVAAGRRAAVRLAAGAGGRHFGALRAVDVQRPGVPGRQPAAHRRRHGQRAHRRAAGGDAALHRLAAAGHRRHRHGLRAVRAPCARRPGASGRHLGEPRQPPLPDQPGHLRTARRGGRDLRVPLRAVRRAGDPHRARPAVHRSRLVGGRALFRRAGQGRGVLVGACSARSRARRSPTPSRRGRSPSRR